MRNFLRITRLQAELLKPAVRHIFISDTNYKRTGHLRDCHPDVPYTGGARSFGKDNPVLMEVMLDLWKQIQGLQSSSGGRLYGLDVFGLAACIFAVRITMQKVRHGHHERWAPRLERSAKQFIERLELERKRQMRSVRDEVGTDVYKRATREWRSFLRFLRYHYLYCGCSYRRRNNVYRIRRMTIDHFCSLTEGELKSRHEPIPTNLRELVRRHLSYIRRGRTSYFIPQLRKDPVFAGSRFANYVVHRAI